MSHESVNTASSTGSGGYMGAFSAIGRDRGSGGGPFLSFRGFGSSREKKTPLPRNDFDDAPAPPSPEQISYQAVTTTGQPEVADTAPILAPPGAPLEGRWVEERYCGLTTWVITLLTGCVCSYFCPCDRRTVWISKSVKVMDIVEMIADCYPPDKRPRVLYNERGAVTDDYIFLNPFPPGCCCHSRPSDQHVVVV